MADKMSAHTNALNWFEISVSDIGRAVRFYESSFDLKMHFMDLKGTKMALFPPTGEGGKVSGALVQSSMHQPGKQGAIVYLNANPDLQLVLDRMKHMGARTILPKTHINDETGFMAYFEDSEGNMIGLHSNQ